MEYQNPVVPVPQPVVSMRVVLLSAIAILIGALGGVLARFLTALIGLITNLTFYHRVGYSLVSPGGGHQGLLLLVIPVVGGLIVGLLARFGSMSIRGHGIPEVMENILHSRSRIPARVLVLKPISAAIAIGTGGPFGAEGPIIATGGALGSLFGQWVHVTADERKTLLAAGAAAGMAATFGTPVSAVLLAIELLLFEYRARSIIPVALASSAATAVRIAFLGTAPAFAVPSFPQPSGAALATYVGMGVIIGAFAVLISRAIYWIEDTFEHLPVHWMWWPPIGAVAVGVCGLIEPRSLGIGYDTIEQIASGHILGIALISVVVFKFISWSIYLGSGTSGGTLAPLFMMGGGLGVLVGDFLAAIAPGLGLNVTVCALVGMAAMFAGASHALLAAVVFAFETTRQPFGLLPLLASCGAAYLTALLLAPHSIMTEKLARRGRVVRTEYVADVLSQIMVRDVASSDVKSLNADESVAKIRDWLHSEDAQASHQGFPVIDDAGKLIGVVTRRDLLDMRVSSQKVVRDLIRRPPAVVFGDSSLRDAADHMARIGVGRLPVVKREDPLEMVGIISRSDLLSAHTNRIEAASVIEKGYASRLFQND